MAKIAVINGKWQDELYKLEDSSVDLIIIDPPYLTTKEAWDSEEQVSSELARQLFRIAKDSCSLYVWCGIGEKSQSLIRWFPVFSELWHFKDLITWKKQRGIGMRKGWLYTREEIMWFVKDNKKFVWNKEHQYSDETRKRDRYGIKDGQNGKPPLSINKRLTNVWDDFTELGADVLYGKCSHYTPKPKKATERIIELHTKEGDMVLDCFAGSGTTGVVAKKMNRNCILVESDPGYIELINERLADG